MNAVNLANDQKLLNEMIERQLKSQNKFAGHLARFSGVGFMDHTQIIDDGAVVALSSDDPLRENLEVLQAYLDTALDNVENGIRGTLINIYALS